MFSPSFAIVNTPLLYTAPPIPPALLFTNLVALIVKCPLFVIAPPSLVQELFVNSQEVIVFSFSDETITQLSFPVELFFITQPVIVNVASSVILTILDSQLKIFDPSIITTPAPAVIAVVLYPCIVEFSVNVN